MIPYGKHKIFPSDIDAVTKVLDGGFLTQGEQVPLFEQSVCDYTGANYAVACNSGTSGLHIACMALDISKNDIVWTVPNSFVASANCARYCDADVDFVDIDPATRNICLQSLEQKLIEANKAQRIPKVLVVVHFSGSSCDMKSIAELTSPYNIKIIEDAAHALGATDADGHKVGRCAYSSLSVLSFHPVKSITSAEGGMVLTNNADLASRLRRLATHGITRDVSSFDTEHVDEPWFYAQIELGFNYRLSDIHAALGRSQLTQLDNFVTARVALAKRYNELLAELPITLPIMDESSSWHLYTIELQTHDRKKVFNALRAGGVGVNVHYIPIHYHPYYRSLGFEPGMFPNAENYYASAITLPLYPTLSFENQDKVVKQLSEALR